MKQFFLLAILGMAQLCHAQKLHRHEITIGYYGGYFFDEIPLRFQKFYGKKNIPTFTYTLLWNNKFDIGVAYGEHRLGGKKVNPDELLPPNTILGRIIRHHSLDAGFRAYSGNFVTRFSVGIDYRTGFKAKFLYQINHGNWVESFSEYKDYKDLGLAVGISIRYPIVRRFFGELTVNYVRYFSSFDKNLLMPGYRIGFRF